LRQGFTVVLAGRPNAGKSSLMNALAKREVAIVSSSPGTTRDVIEVTLNLEGVPVVLVDTAGLRDAADEIEQEGIRRARARAEAADLVLWLVASDEDDAGPVPLWRIGTKADLARFDSDSKRMISVRTGEGVSELLSDLATFACESLRPEEPTIISRERHRQALSEAVDCLSRIDLGLPLEVCAEELRLASRALSSLIGLVGPEDVLGEIFGRFCIGK
jgi:tRNA modification GTPase